MKLLAAAVVAQAGAGTSSPDCDVAGVFTPLSIFGISNRRRSLHKQHVRPGDIGC